MKEYANGANMQNTLRQDICYFRASNAGARIEEIHAEVTKNVSEAKRAADCLERLEKTLVDAATGRNQVSLSVALTMIFILGGALLISILGKSDKSFHLGLDGFSISQPQNLTIQNP